MNHIVLHLEVLVHQGRLVLQGPQGLLGHWVGHWVVQHSQDHQDPLDPLGQAPQVLLLMETEKISFRL